MEDGGLWDWLTPAGWANSRDTSTEVTYPKRLVQQIESEEEMTHDHLDTRAENSTGDTSVSCNKPSSFLLSCLKFGLCSCWIA